MLEPFAAGAGLLGLAYKEQVFDSPFLTGIFFCLNFASFDVSLILLAMWVLCIL